MMGEGEGKISYRFVPIPKSFCAPEFFRSPNLFIFICWIFGRIAFEKRTVHFYTKVIDLDSGEFIFGRRNCSQETGISEQTIRTLVKFLQTKGMLKKSTSKSTNKFTVYALLWRHFLEIDNQQTNMPSTSNQPATNHNLEYKNIEIRKQQAAAIVHNFSNLEDPFKTMLSSLPTDEQKKVLKLFKQRSEEKPIANPAAWVSKCIKNGWHKKKELEEVDIQSKLEETKMNRELAQKACQSLKHNSDVHIRLRNDFLEIGGRKYAPWQIFFYESPNAFQQQLESAIRKLGLFPNEILKTK